MKLQINDLLSKQKYIYIYIYIHNVRLALRKFYLKHIWRFSKTWNTNSILIFTLTRFPKIYLRSWRIIGAQEYFILSSWILQHCLFKLFACSMQLWVLFLIILLKIGFDINISLLFVFCVSDLFIWKYCAHSGPVLINDIA